MGEPGEARSRGSLLLGQELSPHAGGLGRPNELDRLVAHGQPLSGGCVADNDFSKTERPPGPAPLSAVRSLTLTVCLESLATGLGCSGRSGEGHVLFCAVCPAAASPRTGASVGTPPQALAVGQASAGLSSVKIFSRKVSVYGRRGLRSAISILEKTSLCFNTPPPRLQPAPPRHTHSFFPPSRAQCTPTQVLGGAGGRQGLLSLPLPRSALIAHRGFQGPQGSASGEPAPALPWDRAPPACRRTPRRPRRGRVPAPVLRSRCHPLQK